MRTTDGMPSDGAPSDGAQPVDAPLPDAGPRAGDPTLGRPCATGRGACSVLDRDSGGIAPSRGDCDDEDPAGQPEADESCNGIDDACDGVADEGGVCAG